VQPGRNRVSDADHDPRNQPEFKPASSTGFARVESERAPLFAVEPFVPRRFLRNRHLQTITGNFLPRVDRLPAAEAELVKVAPATDSHPPTRVLCHCHWQPPAMRSAAPTAILLHGLEGSSDSQYIVGNANKMWRAGANIVRMNMRNCGGTEQLSTSLYHSGLSGDVAAVMQHFVARESLESVALVGYSMGGNLVLKLAGDLGAHSPKYLRSVVGISPAIDLGPSAAALHRPENRLYERRFLRALLKRFRLKAGLFPDLFDRDRAEGIRSLWEFDDRITAAYSGFASADDYYHRAAAARVIRDISVPALIIHSSDDTFVTLTGPTISDIKANPNVTFVQTAYGGHCAFLANPKDEDDGYWAEAMLLRFILAHA
jgi:predicted alpha/beta-fold hydrolase